MKTKYYILLSNVILIIIGFIIASLVSGMHAENISSGNLLEEIFNVVSYYTIIIAITLISLTGFSFVGAIVFKILHKKELVIGFGINLILNLIIILILYFYQ